MFNQKRLWCIFKFFSIFILLNLLLLVLHSHKRLLLVHIGLSFNPRNFVAALDSQAKTVDGPDGNRRRLVLLAMTDVSFSAMAINLYETSLKRFGVENYLFIGTGKEACSVLLQRDINCFYYADDPNSNQSNSYGSHDFIRKMNIRTKMIIEALDAGFSVLHTDLDVVFLANPMPDIEARLSRHEIMALWDDSAYNAGFIVINPSDFSRGIYQTVKSKTDKSGMLDDQRALNQAFSEAKANNPSNFSEKVHVLDTKKYLCGLAYFEQRNMNFAPLNSSLDPCGDCLVVHNNWIVSKEAKVYRFKERLFWSVDDDAYYSSTRRNYLSYANPFIAQPPSSESLSNVEVEALKSAFAIARMLDRVLVLPRVHCRGWKKKEECSLLDYLSIRHLDKHFAENYRESSFFLHPLIPKHLKEYKTFYSLNHLNKAPPSFTIWTNLSAPYLQQINYNETNLLNFSSNAEVGEKEILENLGIFRDPVLHISSLLGIKIKFTKKESNEEFEKLLKESFVRKAYRQF